MEGEGEEEARAGSPICPHLGMAEESAIQEDAAAGISFCFAWRTPIEVDEERQSYYCRTDMFPLCPRRALGAVSEPPSAEPDEPQGDPATQPDRRSPEGPRALGKRWPVIAAVAVAVLAVVVGTAALLGTGAISPAGAGGSLVAEQAATSRAPAVAPAGTALPPGPGAASGQAVPTRGLSPSPGATGITGQALAGGSTSGAAATPTLEPAPNMAAYQVPYGDTLTKISIRFGVSIEELMETNGIVDRDMILSGRTLVIPGPKMTVTPTPGT